jgi:predicted enzyme related to lactoylglutathione lyase
MGAEPMFRLIEVILYVRDMARQVAYYRRVFGLPILEPQGVTDSADQYWVVLDGGGFRLVLHGGGEGRLGEDTPNLGFAVADIQAARAHLVAHGVTVGEIRSPVPGSFVIDGHDPEGNRWSVVQRV